MKTIFKYKGNNLIRKYSSITELANELCVDESNVRYYIKGNKEYKGFLFTDKIKNEDNRVLVIGDLHAPFQLNEYFDFCKKIYNKYDCNQVVFIGDIIDQHYHSMHSTDADGHSAAEELRLAKIEIARWYEEYPNAKVCRGNHDMLVNRQAFKAGLSQSWIKGIDEVLNTPTWSYSDEFIIDNVLYTHGTGRKATQRMSKDLISVVQGHYHSESYINYLNGRNSVLFAMQVGCGCDRESYAMAYGKHFNEPHINCGVVLNNGRLPILEYMY